MTPPTFPDARTAPKRPLRAGFALALGLSIGLSFTHTAQAQTLPRPKSLAPDSGKLLATGGVTQVEGAGGGGLTPWALITSYATEDSYGANAFYTVVRTQDYALDSRGAAVGFADRFELSFANQRFTGSKAPLNNLVIRQDVVGAKLRVAGDAVYAQDRWLPQIAVGAQYKRNKGVAGLEALGVSQASDLGAKRNSDTDYYVSATKILLDQSLLWNLTLRATRANQFGLLGFGGDKKDRYEVLPEASVAYLINRKVAAGVEYRAKPRNLGLDREKDAYDAFVAWFPNRNVSVTAAYVNLGDITVLNPTRQKGWYLSAQVGF
jgi:hypothetical protein